MVGHSGSFELKESSKDEGKKVRRRFIAWASGIALFVSIGIGAAGFWYYSGQKRQRLTEYGKQLEAIADLKIHEIQTWRRERLGDARIAVSNPLLSSAVKALQARPKPENPSEGFFTWLDAFRAASGYRDVIVYGAAGRFLCGMRPDSEANTDVGVRRAVADALAKGTPVLTNLYFPEDPGSFGMDVLAPIPDSEKTGRSIGVLDFRINPHDYLYPFLQKWPTPSDSAETLLVCREGGDVLYLNELRHRKGAAGRLRLPTASVGLPAAAAVLGRYEILEGRDYRRVRVLAATRAIPDSPWFLVAKVDLDEILVPVRREGRILALLCLALIAAACAATGYFIRREQVATLRLTAVIKARSAQAVRESQEKFEYVFEYSPVGKSITLPGGEIKVNKAFQDMLGYSREELENEKWQEITFPDDIEPTQRALDGLLRGEQSSARFQKRYVHKSGRIVWTDVQTSLRRDTDGRPLYFVTVISDITDRKQAVDEIIRLNAELDDRVRRRTAQLEDVNRELEAFSYSVSHDLRAPLRIIDGFSQALLEDYGDRIDEEGKGHLGRIRSNAQFMGRLIDDMLKLARLSKAEIRAKDIDLSGLARESAADIACSYPNHVVDLAVADGLTVRSDPRLLRAVLDNLFDNAWKFTVRTSRPRVEFGSRSGEGGPVYFVRDNGIGFDMTYVGKLFVAFQRLHAREEFPGTGIGLATVQRIVGRLDGRVWAEGRESLGATFFFTLNETERRIG